MAKVQPWDEAKWKKELLKRLTRAKKYRERFEGQWRINERTVYNANSRRPEGVTIGDEDNLIVSADSDGGEGGSAVTDMAINYAWKFVRFIHSQMSANPPSVMAKPTSSDSEDRAKADAADRIVRHAISDQDLQEVFDQSNLKCLTYGTAYTLVEYDVDGGEAYDYDDKEGDLTMEGKVVISSPSVWDIWLDPDACHAGGLRHYFRSVDYTLEEAEYKFDKYKDKIASMVQARAALGGSELKEDYADKEDIVRVFYYIEKGLPVNGMAGRMACCLEDGTLLCEPSKNTNPNASLGLSIETDIDVPDQVYGKSFVEYIFKLQDLLNRLDTSFVENIAAHNVVRMILPQGAEIEDASLSNSGWDYVTITGNSGNAPYFVPAAQLMPDAHKLRENLISGIQELAGVNDSMMGVQKREMSGFSMQTAIDAGNQTRRRLFNKFTRMVRETFKMYLEQVKEHWDTPRKILVLGREKAFESAEFTGADISGGFDIICEYGASLSLDPSRRREEIMQLMPVFEKAGVLPKTILGMLKLNELEGLYDRMQLAADRQREIFDEMIATGKTIEPRELQDHAGMLDYAYFWVMSAEYKYLDEDTKSRIDAHIKAREQFAAQAATKGQGAPGAPMAAPAAPGQPMPAAPIPTGPAVQVA